MIEGEAIKRFYREAIVRWNISAGNLKFESDQGLGQILLMETKFESDQGLGEIFLPETKFESGQGQGKGILFSYFYQVHCFLASVKM